MLLSVWTALLVLGLPAVRTVAQSVPCSERPGYLSNPWTIPQWCLEQVVSNPDSGPLGFSALAVGDDGTLYATRPLLGQVLALRQGGDGELPANPQIIIEGLTLPNGLTYYNGALYISAGPGLYRWRDGGLETLVDDLPFGAGFWTGGLTVGPDERVYVAIGAPCDACTPDDPLRGSILSFTLDGEDRQVVATGLRSPADVAFMGDTLWTADTAPDAAAGLDLDELNRVEPGANYGWPECLGPANCGDSLPPAMTFPTHSTPLALAAYANDLFPSLTGTLLVILGGSNNEAQMQGFALVAVHFDGDTPSGYRLLVPGQSENDPNQFNLQEYNYRGSGFWPRRPLGVAVSPEGWVYVSVGDGRIFAMRPL